MGSLEDTIRKLHDKYKNRPSVLSEEYRRSNANVHFMTQQNAQPNNPRSALIGNFVPPPKSF